VYANQNEGFQLQSNEHGKIKHDLK